MPVQYNEGAERRVFHAGISCFLPGKRIFSLFFVHFGLYLQIKTNVPALFPLKTRCFFSVKTSYIITYISLMVIDCHAYTALCMQKTNKKKRRYDDGYLYNGAYLPYAWQKCRETNGQD